MNWKLLVVALLVGACVGGAVQQWRLGGQIAQAQTDLAKADEKHARDLKAIADHAASEASAALAETARAASSVAAIEQTYRMEQTNAQKTIDALRADVRAGDVRLRIATASCSPATRIDGTPGTGTAAGGTDGAGTAELDGSTADTLLGITGDGDRAIRKLNGLQEYAREAQRVCGIR